MITTNELAESTGISTRTLTRWHKQGILPEPLVRTHPSGRGKVGYWPDWVLDRIRRIQDLRAEGHTLRSALLHLEMKRWDQIVERVQDSPDMSEVLKGVTVKLGEDREANLFRILVTAVLQTTMQITSDPALFQKLASAFDEKEVNTAFTMIKHGFNPVLVFDGKELQVTPDFMVAHRLYTELREMTSLLAIPLYPVIKKILGKAGEKLPEPNTWPAPKVWGRQKDAIVEYDIYLGGMLGFELIHSSAKTIGMLRSSSHEGESTHDE